MRAISRSLPTSAPGSCGSPGKGLGCSKSGIFFAWRENMTLRFSPIARRCLERALLQQGSEFVGRQGSAEVEALRLIAAVLLEEGDVLLGLHAFGRDFQIEFQRERDDR